MRLLVSGLSLPIAQMGPDFVLLDEPVNHGPATATMVMQVDKSERRWNVHLPNGISAKSARVADCGCRLTFDFSSKAAKRLPTVLGHC